MSARTRIGRALCAALLAGALGACDFASPTTANPNQVPNASLPQLFTGLQVNTFFFSESQINRAEAVWIQQVAGTTRQYSALDRYIFDAGTAGGSYNMVYAEGGLVSIQAAQVLAREAGCRVCLGILQIYEGFMMGTAADAWGDIPYSEALTPENGEDPMPDDQAAVYDSVQTVLSAAIENLQSGEVGTGATFLSQDFNFSGAQDVATQAARWIAVAHTLKARYHLHLAEVDQGRYQQALQQARQGIETPVGNFVAVHEDAAGEKNVWNQFTVERSGYITAGATLVSLMNGGTPADFSDDDPRLSIYFQPTTALTENSAPLFVGSPAGNPEGDPGTNAAQLNTTPGGFVAPFANQPIATCAENYFIIAEASARLGDEAGAGEALAQALECEEQVYDIELTSVEDLLARPNDTLLETILTEKYIALFLNFEAYNDYRRTCLPEEINPLDRLNSLGGEGIPGRFYYSQQATQTNQFLLDPNEQPPRNDNNPNPCGV